MIVHMIKMLNNLQAVVKEANDKNGISIYEKRLNQNSQLFKLATDIAAAS